MKMISTFALLLFSLVLQAQTNEIYIDIPLYFEDSVGNKDTVVISLAESGSIDFEPALGEVNLNGVPYDSAFEVRIVSFKDAASAYEFEYQVSRKFIELTLPLPGEDCSATRISGNVAFVVHARHYPITISWDSAPFQAGGLLECAISSRIGNTFLSLIMPPEVSLPTLMNDPAYPLGCLSLTEKIQYYPYNSYPIMGQDFPRGLFNPFNDWTLLPVEGSDLALDTMLIYSLWWANNRSPLCKGPVSTQHELPATAVSLFPNPTANLITLDLNDPDMAIDSYAVFDMLGRQVFFEKTGARQLDVSNLPGGTYLVRAQLSDRRTVTARFVRQ
jgi:hypothetical protein